MIDWTITAGNVLTIVTMAVGAVAAFFSLRGRLDLTQSKAREAFEIAKMTRDSLQEFKIEVTREYTRYAALEKLEAATIAQQTRTLKAIEALTERIDRLVDSFDAAQRRGARARKAVE